MSEMTNPSPGRTERYTRWVIRNRWWVVLSALLVAVASGTGMSKLGLANDYRVFFSEDNPDLNAFEAVENIYTKNDNVLFIVKPREGEVFTAANLKVIRSLTEDAWQIPFSTRVDAITNFQHTWADGDELIVEDLVGRGEITPDVVARARRVSLAEPLLTGRLIAPDALTTGVNVRISLRGEAVDELAQTVAYARGLVAEYSEAHPELEIQVGGLSMLNWAFAEAPMRDLPVVMPTDVPDVHDHDRAVPAFGHRAGGDACCDRILHGDRVGNRWAHGCVSGSDQRVGAHDHPDAGRGGFGAYPGLVDPVDARGQRETGRSSRGDTCQRQADFSHQPYHGRRLP